MSTRRLRNTFHPSNSSSPALSRLCRAGLARRHSGQDSWRASSRRTRSGWTPQARLEGALQRPLCRLASPTLRWQASKPAKASQSQGGGYYRGPLGTLVGRLKVDSLLVVLLVALFLSLQASFSSLLFIIIIILLVICFRLSIGEWPKVCKRVKGRGKSQRREEP